MGKIGIVVAQTYQKDLEQAKKVLGNNPALEVCYVSEPAKALALIPFGLVDILVTGQRFYGPAIKNPDSESLDLYLQNLLRFDEKSRHALEENARRYDGLIDGNDIAQCAKGISPTILTLRYSTTPSENAFFCGDLDKWDGKGLAVLGDPAFLDAYTERKIGKLPQSSLVQWYPQNFPDNWK